MVLREGNYVQTVKEFLGEGLTIRTKNEIERILGYQINFVEFFRLRNCLDKIKRKVGTGLSRKIEVLTVGKKKGAGNLRKIINTANGVILSDVHPYLNTLRQEENTTTNIKECWLESWRYSKLEARFKNFVLSFVCTRTVNV
jgi:hypothetical protein